MSPLQCYSLLARLAIVCLVACTSTRQDNSTAGGSDWLPCVREVDCEGHPDADHCADDGYCVDAAGARVRMVPTDGGHGDADGDGDGASVGCQPSTERCNGVDDDCDRAADEAAAADADCETRAPNRVTYCARDKGLCVLHGCISGFTECDGDPGSGCVPADQCSGMDDDAGE